MSQQIKPALLKSIKTLNNVNLEKEFGEETNKKIKHELRLFLSDDKRVCRKCEEDRFHIYIRYGSGGSGVYFVFVCIKCGTTITIDIDNPNYEG